MKKYNKSIQSNRLKVNIKNKNLVIPVKLWYNIYEFKAKALVLSCFALITGTAVVKQICFKERNKGCINL